MWKAKSLSEVVIRGVTDWICDKETGCGDGVDGSGYREWEDGGEELGYSGRQE